MVIAITGGIGSGKSKVRNIIESMGGYTIDADAINSELLLKPSYIAKIRELFSEAITNDMIDRKKLAGIIFSDEKALIKLNSLAHPLIIGIIMYEANSVTDRHVFVEIPLIKDIGMYNNFDRIWLIRADLDVRIKRVQERDRRDLDQIMQIIRAQGSDDKVSEIASEIIYNDREEKLWEEVARLYSSL